MSIQAPFLSEHQAVEPDSSSYQNSPTYDPTDEEKKAIDLVNRLYERAKKFRKQYDQNWLDNYKFFRGRQWKETRPAYRHSEVINMIFQTIEAQVPVLMDSRPRIEFIPTNPQDRVLSDIVNEVIENEWVESNWLYQLTEMVFDAHLYGCGLGEMGYDPKGRYGIGQAKYSSLDPFYMFPDPSARDFNDRCNYTCYAEPIDLEELKREYPNVADYLKADLTDLVEGNKANLDQVRFKSPTDSKTIMEGASAYNIGVRDQALKIVCYLKSDEFIEEVEKTINKTTNEPEDVTTRKKKYPKGRKIVIASGVLCEDGENPYDDGEFPYFKLTNYILPREFWGMSEVEQLQGPQKVFNKLVNFALDVYTLMGNPIWVVGTNSGVDTENLFNRPGLVVEAEDIEQVKREQGMEINPSLFQLMDRMRTWFNETSGMTDVSRGAEPQDVTSGVAIQSLQEAAQTRLRQKSRNMDNCLQRAGQLWISRAFQFYSAPTIYQLTKNPAAPEYFKFYIETQMNENGVPVLNEAGDPVRIARITPFEMNPESQAISEGAMKEFIVRGELKARVSTGSTLPFAKAEKTNLSMKLFQLGVIDDEELLKNIDYPNYEAVLDRVNQKKQAMMAEQAQMAQAQAQAKSGGGAPPPGPPPGGPPPH